MATNNKNWVGFYGPDGKCLCAYTIQGTFRGELQATKEELAAEYGIRTEEIDARLEARPPRMAHGGR